MSVSPLPNLRTRRTASSALSAPASVSTDANPVHIKREVNRLITRLDSIENGIRDIKSQIPQDLNKIVQQLRDDILTLEGKKNNNTEQRASDDVMQQKLTDLENRLHMQLDVSLEASNASLETKIHEINKAKQKDFTSIINENSFDSFGAKMLNFETSMSSQQKKTQQRIATINKTLSKLLESMPNDEEKFTKVKELDDAIEVNRRHASELRTKISDLKIQYERQNAIKKIQQLQTTTTTETTNTKNTQVIAVSKVPDLSASLGEFKQEINDLQTKYSDKIRIMKEKASMCEAKVKKVDQIAIEIVTSTTTLESRITEVDILCKSLVQQVKGLQERSGENGNQQLIKQLTEKVLEEHQKLKSELGSVKARAEKCQAELKIRSGEA